MLMIAGWKKNNKGFSLVELIIVVAIMAVLIGVLAPQYIKYVEKSRATRDDDQADSLLTAVHVIVADEDYFGKISANTNVEMSGQGVVIVPADQALSDALDEYLNGWANLQVQSKTYDNKTYVVKLTQTNGVFDVTSSWQ